MTMRVLPGISEVGSVVRVERERGRRIAFVPTMGNLHEGHLALVRQANEVADFTVVSIFVNPFQFGEGEDYGTYPRTLDADVAALETVGVDLVFVPEVADFYPNGLDRVTRVEVPDLGSILCGEFRPGFFRGVTTVVSMLFNVVQPDAAVFGEKDYQQFVVIKRMVDDLKMPIEIVPGPTVREPDGLAMSSRNVYLTSDERRRAPILQQALCTARDALLNGERRFQVLENKGLAKLRDNGFRPDYFAIRRADNLTVPESEDCELQILAAAWLGSARLIDNVAARRRR
jgi:pantoate--beta-alanine ligase